METKQAIHGKEVIGILVRNGRQVFYAYIDGKRVERLLSSTMYKLVRNAAEQGKQVGA